MRPALSGPSWRALVLGLFCLSVRAGDSPVAASPAESSPTGTSPADAGNSPAGNPERLFDQGRALFAEAQAAKEKSPDQVEIRAKFIAAAESFVAAWKAGAATTEVFTNAANGYSFGGKLGLAVLYYRRALAADATNETARRALDSLRDVLPIRKAPGGSSASILRSLFFWHDLFPFRTRRALFLVAFPAAFLCFALSFWRRQPFFLAGFVLLVPSLLLLGSVLLEAFGGTASSEAIVMVDVEGRRGNGSSYSPSHSRPFPGGTEVTILERRRGDQGTSEKEGTWIHVRLIDGSDSWIAEGTVERVLP